MSQLSDEVHTRLDKLDAKIAKLKDDKAIIEQKMFDCGAILKVLELGNVVLVIARGCNLCERVRRHHGHELTTGHSN